MASVESIAQMNDAEFEAHTLDILRRELGLSGFARYLQAHRPLSGDYTRDRHTWLEGMSIDDIVRAADRH
jgi:hypothetical protein